MAQNDKFRVVDEEKFREKFGELVERHRKAMTDEIVNPKHFLIKRLVDMIYIYYGNDLDKKWMKSIFQYSKSLDVSIAVFSATLQLEGMKKAEQVVEEKAGKVKRRSHRKKR